VSGDAPQRETIRLDKWLWHARFLKSRSLATAFVSSGKVRVDSTPVSKPARLVGDGDVLTFAIGEAVKVVRITAIGTRRGPAPEAQALYEDLSPPPAPRAKDQPSHNPAFDGTGRPGKRERRNMASHLRANADFDLE